VEAVNEGKGPFIDQYLIFLEFKDVFPKYFPRFAPERELDFTIEIKPGVNPISKTPYRMKVP